MTVPGISVDWNWVRDNMTAAEKIPAGKLTESLEAGLKKAKSLVRPRCIASEKKILSNLNGSVKVEGDITLSSRTLSSHLKKAASLAIFLVTIGKDVEDEATRLMNSGEELAGYLMDRIGSFAVESLAENLEKEFRRSYGARGLSLSSRFSPGYCDWKIEEQFKLDRIMNFSGAGVVLTENCMMVPRKSISAVAGIGAKGLFSKRQPQCVTCGMPDCSYRRDR